MAKPIEIIFLFNNNKIWTETYSFNPLFLQFFHSYTLSITIIEFLLLTQSHQSIVLANEIVWVFPYCVTENPNKLLANPILSCLRAFACAFP